LLWKDATGRVASLSEHFGKPALVVFWLMAQGASDTLISVLDSVHADMKDSVFILAIAEDRTTPHCFASGVLYDTINHVQVQMVTDSAERAHIQYAQFSDGTLVHPETFILKSDGH